MKVIIFSFLSIIFLTANVLFAQVEINLPKEITVYLNEEPFEPTLGWMDSLVGEAQENKLLYRLSQANKNVDRTVDARIKMPQFLTLPEVIRQVIFYYALLSNETDRRLERLYIFPYFAEFDAAPMIVCSYKSTGIYHLTVNKWQHIDTPVPPRPEERYIYNQIMKISFASVHEFSSLPPEIFSEVALNNNIEVNDVIRIYQNVYLWNLSK